MWTQWLITEPQINKDGLDISNWEAIKIQYLHYELPFLEKETLPKRTHNSGKDKVWLKNGEFFLVQ